MNPNAELMFTQRSGRQAEQLGIFRPDCLNAMSTGGVIRSNHLGPDWRRTIEGRDMDGNLIRLVVTVVQTSDIHRKRIVVLDCERGEESNGDAA